MLSFPMALHTSKPPFFFSIFVIMTQLQITLDCSCLSTTLTVLLGNFDLVTISDNHLSTVACSAFNYALTLLFFTLCLYII